MIRETPSVRARALSGMATEDTRDGQKVLTAKVTLEILEGPDAGQRITYNGLCNSPKATAYVAQDLKAVGWKGKTFSSLALDIESTRAEPNIEIQHKQTKDGLRTFAVVRSMGDGRAAKQDVPASQDTLTNADMMLTGSGSAIDDSDIPF